MINIVTHAYEVFRTPYIVLKDTHVVEKLGFEPIPFVATLALGLRPSQGVARLQAKKKTRESHHMLSRVQRV